MGKHYVELTWNSETFYPEVVGSRRTRFLGDRLVIYCKDAEDAEKLSGKLLGSIYGETLDLPVDSSRGPNDY